MVGIVALLDEYESLDPYWKPGFGEESCWFIDTSSCSEGNSWFVYGPMVLVLLINSGVFIHC